MEEKFKGWKEGVLGKTLAAVGGYKLLKGSIVRFRKYKVYPDKDGFRMTESEFHVMDENNSNLIRVTKLIVDDVEFSIPLLK